LVYKTGWLFMFRNFTSWKNNTNGEREEKKSLSEASLK